MSSERDAGPSVARVPEGDTRTRLVCPDCGYVAYENPKVIVGAVCVWRDRVLLCRRAIEPRRGFWTVPAGYLEVNETTAQGAEREVWEEARARVRMGGLIGIYEIPGISQIYVIYRARLVAPEVSAGPESEDVRLFTWDDIPWDDLAFSGVSWALKRYRDGKGPGVATAAASEAGS